MYQRKQGRPRAGWLSIRRWRLKRLPPNGSTGQIAGVVGVTRHTVRYWFLHGLAHSTDEGRRRATAEAVRAFLRKRRTR